MNLEDAVRVRMTIEMKNILEKIAEKRGTQVSSIIRHAILEFLDKNVNKNEN